MNCRIFESVIDDIARGALMDAAAREEALTHASACGRCGARLSDERALTAGLRTVASQAATLDAPARVEAALLAAFRERTAAPAQTVASSAVVLRPSAWWLPRWAQGAAVAAASMLLVFGLYTAFVGRQDETTPARAGKSNAHAPAVAASQEPTQQLAAGVPGGVNVSEGAGDDDAEGLNERDAPTQARAGGRAQVLRTGYQLASNGNAARLSPPPAPAPTSADEIMTEFIPLMNGGNLMPGDSGHIIRVELPRTALASFGLPVNAEQQGGRVRADVLMGEDGIARAIRFVR